MVSRIVREIAWGRVGSRGSHGIAWDLVVSVFVFVCSVPLAGGRGLVLLCLCLFLFEPLCGRADPVSLCLFVFVQSPLREGGSCFYRVCVCVFREGVEIESVELTPHFVKEL